jgi:MFS family permease
MKNRQLFLLLSASALSAMSYGVMFTMLDDYRDKYSISESKLGLIVAAGFITGFLANVLIAPFADKGHAKRLVMLGILMEIVGCLTMAFGGSFAILLLGRFLTGLGGGSVDPSIRRIIILASPHEMGRNLGLTVSAGVGGFALGPVISALTADAFGLAAPFLIICVLLALTFIGIARLHVNEADAADAPKQRLAFDLLRIRPILGAIIIGLALFVMIGTFDSLWSIMMDDIDAPTWVASVGITIFALPMLFLAPLGGRMTQKVGPFKASISGLSIAALFMTMYGIIGSPYVMMGIGLVHGVVDGLTITGGSAAIALVAPKDRLASAQGLYSGMQTLMGGLTAGAAGLTYEHIGRNAFWVCTLVMLAMIGTGAFIARDHLQIKG